MIHLGVKVVRKWLEALLHIHDSPQRTAVAYALGVFFGFSPLLGLHTLLALLFAFLLRLNRVAIVLGVYTDLPFVTAPYYTLATVAGARLLGIPLPEAFGRHVAGLFELSFFERAFWLRLDELVQPLLWPYAVGSTIGAILLAVASYWVALFFVIEGRKHIHLKSHAVRHEDGA